MRRTEKEQMTFKQKAYEIIKNKILRCEFLPGEDISVESISGMIQCSRTPVRDALLMLEQEKLVNIYPKKGVIISPITIKDVSEVLEIRGIVEPQVAKTACKSMDKEDLLRFKERFKNIENDAAKLEDESFFNLDIEFHKFIVYHGDNKYLIEFIEKIFDLDYRIRFMASKSLKNEKNRYTFEHFEIIDALISQDEREIETALTKHIQNAREAALRGIIR